MHDTTGCLCIYNVHSARIIFYHEIMNDASSTHYLDKGETCKLGTNFWTNRASEDIDTDKGETNINLRLNIDLMHMNPGEDIDL